MNKITKNRFYWTKITRSISIKLIQHLTILLLTKRCVSNPLQLQHCQFESRLLSEWSKITHIHFPSILYTNTKLLKSNNACRWAVVAALRRAHYCGAKLVRSWVRISLDAGLFSALLYPINSACSIPVTNGGATLQTHDQQVVDLNFHNFSKCVLT